MCRQRTGGPRKIPKHMTDKVQNPYISVLVKLYSIWLPSILLENQTQKCNWNSSRTLITNQFSAGTVKETFFQYKLAMLFFLCKYPLFLA